MKKNDNNLNDNNSEIMKPVQNDNKNSYYKTLDKNFNNAIELFERKIPHHELIKLLQTGNIVQKQVAALKMTELKDTEETQILVNNLVRQDGKIREAVSLKILELIQNPEFSLYFQDKNIYDIFLKAIMDVNSNVCRNIISAISILKNNNEFCAYFTKELIKLTNNLIKKVKEFDFEEGTYKVNKEFFKLYWCLETIFILSGCIDIPTLKNIIKQTKDINEYTIREKTAKILSKDFADPELNKIRCDLKNDPNYYVRRF